MSKAEVPAKTLPKTFNAVETVSEMMNQLQQEINEVKTGVLGDSEARHVRGLRGHQLKAAELQIQYARIYKGRVPDPQMRLTSSATTVSESSNNKLSSNLTEEEQRTLEALLHKAGVEI